MEFVTGKKVAHDMDLSDLVIAEDGSKVCTHGMVYSIKDMGEFGFVTIRKSNAIVQCIYSKENSGFELSSISPESAVSVEGELKKDDRAPNGFEIHLTGLKVLSKPNEPTPVNLSKRKLGMSLETNLSMRPISLRNNKERAVFKIQEGIVRGFREFLFENNFTEMHSPKIVASGAEGGANIFKLNYFDKKAYLAQSPQFYKQMMVGVFERVFEIGPVFRAEKHNTARHLNEYTSVDFEMGFIDSFYDIIEMETGMLKRAFELLEKEYTIEIKILGLDIPKIDKIPCIKFKDAKELVSKEYNRKIKDPFDLEPEEEQLISQLFEEKYDSEFVFVTHYPSKKRPFYAIDDPEDTKYTLSFDLLFRGMEITTGGQRIHDYNEQVEKMKVKNLDPADFETFLMIHKHGMPPHGGLGMGLERLCMKLMNETHVRTATLFPRDMTRLTP